MTELGPLDWLDPSPGSRLLELGCGLGADVRALAARVAPGGSVVGVDASLRLVEEARARTPRGLAGVTFLVADGRSLPFADGSFDGARVERVLQHVADADAVIRELVRVLRPGGVLVCAEPDWGMLALDSEEGDLARAVLAGYAAAVRQPWMGRSLRRRLLDARLEHVEVVVQPRVAMSVTELPIHTEELIARTQATGLAGADEVRAFGARLRDAEREGRFLAVMTTFSVRGRVPATDYCRSE